LTREDTFPDIFIAETDTDIEACFPAFSTLRPHLQRSEFLPQVRRQQRQSYQILALRDEGLVKSVAGFRYGEFLAWGKIIYIDDLSTLPEQRSRGFAGALLEWLIAHAKSRGCQSVQLDSGHARFLAHRLYMNKGFQIRSHHFSLDLTVG
jgi:GNAT superfamily N-acetyltransferase